MNIQEKVEAYLGKTVAAASDKETYGALLSVVQEMAAEKERTDSRKKLYYISAEFLIGKLLSNNMINLGIYEEVKEMLEQKERGRAGATAPPQGLVLLGIVYDGQADTERGQIQKDTDSSRMREDADGR